MLSDSTPAVGMSSNDSMPAFGMSSNDSAPAVNTDVASLSVVATEVSSQDRKMVMEDIGFHSSCNSIRLFSTTLAATYKQEEVKTNILASSSKIIKAISVLDMAKDVMEGTSFVESLLHEMPGFHDFDMDKVCYTFAREREHTGKEKTTKDLLTKEDYDLITLMAKDASDKNSSFSTTNGGQIDRVGSSSHAPLIGLHKKTLANWMTPTNSLRLLKCKDYPFLLDRLGRIRGLVHKKLVVSLLVALAMNEFEKGDTLFNGPLELVAPLGEMFYLAKETCTDLTRALKNFRVDKKAVDSSSASGTSIQHLEQGAGSMVGPDNSHGKVQDHSTGKVQDHSTGKVEDHSHHVHHVNQYLLPVDHSTLAMAPPSTPVRTPAPDTTTLAMGLPSTPVRTTTGSTPASAVATRPSTPVRTPAPDTTTLAMGPPSTRVRTATGSTPASAVATRTGSLTHSTQTPTASTHRVRTHPVFESIMVRGHWACSNDVITMYHFNAKAKKFQKDPDTVRVSWFPTTNGLKVVQIDHRHQVKCDEGVCYTFYADSDFTIKFKGNDHSQLLMSGQALTETHISYPVPCIVCLAGFSREMQQLASYLRTFLHPHEDDIEIDQETAAFIARNSP